MDCFPVIFLYFSEVGPGEGGEGGRERGTRTHTMKMRTGVVKHQDKGYL